MGLLISIEGGENVGKTSLVTPGLQEIFMRLRLPTKTSREPGGTPIGEALRQEIFKKMQEHADALTLATLFNKARRVHLDEVIIPFIGKNRENKAVIILDRYLDSSRVYQGLEGGLDLTIIRQLERRYVKGYVPDLTIILYYPEALFQTVMQQRISSAYNSKEKSPWEKYDFSFQLQRQRYYLSLPQLSQQWGENRDFDTIDASQSPSTVIKACLTSCIPHIKKVDSNLTEKQIWKVFSKLKKEKYFDTLIQ